MNRGLMKRTTSEPGRLSTDLHTTPLGGRLMVDIRCARSHSQQIFDIIRFRT
ncbi:hypothetical protein AVEN_88805-1, partial [Araneus ventricosus]